MITTVIALLSAAAVALLAILLPLVGTVKAALIAAIPIIIIAAIKGFVSGTTQRLAKKDKGDK